MHVFHWDPFAPGVAQELMKAYYGQAICILTPDALRYHLSGRGHVRLSTRRIGNSVAHLNGRRRRNAFRVGWCRLCVHTASVLSSIRLRSHFWCFNWWENKAPAPPDRILGWLPRKKTKTNRAKKKPDWSNRTTKAFGCARNWGRKSSLFFLFFSRRSTIECFVGVGGGGCLTLDEWHAPIINQQRRLGLRNRRIKRKHFKRHLP